MCSSKHPEKKSQNSVTAPSGARIMPPNPQSGSGELSVLCLHISVQNSVVLAVRGPRLIHALKMLKVAGIV